MVGGTTLATVSGMNLRTRVFALASLTVTLVACSTSTDGPSSEEESDEGALSISDMTTGPGEAPGSVFIPSGPIAFQRGRPGLIRYIVIHDIEGPASAAINLFRRPTGESSSHYVVDAKGGVVQMVKERDIANHAFHSVMNAYAIGIEHDGYAKGVDRNGHAVPYSAALYDGSAKLVADLAKRYRIPLDREHIIGHHQVPKTEEQALPCGPNQVCGGRSGHTDPGPAWDWSGYMARVASAAREIGYTADQALSDRDFALETIQPLAKLDLRNADGSRPRLVGGFWATQCSEVDPRKQITFRTILDTGAPARAETRYRQPQASNCGTLSGGKYPLVFSGYRRAELESLCVRAGDETYKLTRTAGSCTNGKPECLGNPSCVAPGDDCERNEFALLAPADAARLCR